MKKIFVALFLFVFSSFLLASKPLENNDFEKEIKLFCEHSSKNMKTLTTPVTGKKFASPIFFKLNKIVKETKNEENRTRKTKLDVCAPLKKETGNSGKSTSKEETSYEIVGEVLLHESPENTKPDGIFSLHFIEIKEGNKGKGYGSSALDLTIMLAQHLAKYNDFYSILKLQCSDYEGERYLGDVPFRLSYYLDHGLSLSPETLSFMNHMDLKYFIDSFSVKTFKAFLKFNMVDFCETSRGKKIIKSEKLLSNLLDEIKIYARPLKALKEDEKLQIAESNSSKVAEFILNRVFYDSNITDEVQNHSGEWIYSLFLNVKKWQKALEKRKTLIELRRESQQKKYTSSESSDFIKIIEEKASALKGKTIKNKNSKKRDDKENKPGNSSRKKIKVSINN